MDLFSIEVKSKNSNFWPLKLSQMDMAVGDFFFEFQSNRKVFISGIASCHRSKKAANENGKRFRDSALATQKQTKKNLGHFCRIV